MKNEFLKREAINLLKQVREKIEYEEYRVEEVAPQIVMQRLIEHEGLRHKLE